MIKTLVASLFLSLATFLLGAAFAASPLTGPTEEQRHEIVPGLLAIALVFLITSVLMWL